jgi:hypothetical protein
MRRYGRGVVNVSESSKSGQLRECASTARQTVFSTWTTSEASLYLNIVILNMYDL